MIGETLNYLRVNVVKERIIKLEDEEKSIRFFNYPFQALEEAVVNALYHRDYQTREPVEITVEPHRISILSFSGPDRSIPMLEIKAARSLRARRYRNRRLGDFLKELGLTEGRATGIPTIQTALKANGSPLATISTDEDRSFFLIDIPCHSGFEGESVVDAHGKDENVLKDVLKDLSERQLLMLDLLVQNPTLSTKVLSGKLGVTDRTIRREMDFLKKLGIRIMREGGRKQGRWVIRAEEG